MTFHLQQELMKHSSSVSAALSWALIRGLNTKMNNSQTVACIYWTCVLLPRFFSCFNLDPPLPACSPAYPVLSMFFGPSALLPYLLESGEGGDKGDQRWVPSLSCSYIVPVKKQQLEKWNCAPVDRAGALVWKREPELGVSRPEGQLSLSRVGTF